MTFPNQQAAAACKHGEVGCGQYYDCGRCARQRRAKAYGNLTQAQKDYDNFVDPSRAYHNDFPSGCSCHRCAPCSYCTSQPNEDHAQ